MSSGFDSSSSSMNHKYEIPKTDRIQGAPAAESLKNIAQLNPLSFTAKPPARLPVAGVGPAMQIMSSQPGGTTASTLSAPLLPKIATLSSGVLQSTSMPPTNSVERSQSQLQPTSSAPPAAVAAAAAAAASAAAATAPAVGASAFSAQPVQHSAISIIRPSAPLHTSPAAVVPANIFAAGPRVVTTESKKTITAPPTRPVVLPLPLSVPPRLPSVMPGLAVTPAVQQAAVTLAAVATGSPQLLLSQHNTGGQQNPGLRNLTSHSIRPGTPPAPGKPPVGTNPGTTSERTTVADHHRFPSATAQAIGNISSAISMGMPVTSAAVTAVPSSTAASTVQITVHQPKAPVAVAAAHMPVPGVADRLSFARVPSTLPSAAAAGLAAAALPVIAHAPRLIVPQSVTCSIGGAATVQAVSQQPQPATLSAAVQRTVPTASTTGGPISIPMVVAGAGSAAARPAAAQRNAGQHDYSRHEPGASLTSSIHDASNKPMVGGNLSASSAHVPAEVFPGRVNASLSGVGSTAATATTSSTAAYFTQDSLFPSVSASPMTSLGLIASQQQLGSAYVKAQYRTTIYPSQQPIMPATTRTALVLPAVNASRPTTNTFYGSNGQSGTDDVASHSVSAVGGVIVPNAAVGLQQQTPSTAPGSVVGSSSPRPSILRKRAAGESCSAGTVIGARRVLPMAEPLAGNNPAFIKIAEMPAHARPESPKLPSLTGVGSERASASRRSSTDTATDPGLSVDSPSPTSMKHDPMEILENGVPTLPSFTDVSPRKKPRKQLLNMVNDYKEDDYSTEEETETKGLHPITQLRQAHSRDVSKLDRQPTAAAGAPHSAGFSSSSSPAVAKHPKRAASTMDQEKTAVPVKRPKVQVMESYKRVYPWKSQNNHFQRYSDVKAKEEPRLTVNELSNKRGVTKCASGWRLYHLAAQFDAVSQSESDLHDRLSEIQRIVSSMSSQQRGSGRHSLDTSVAADVSMVSELAQACKQRCTLVQSQLKDARDAMLLVLKHKAVIMDIISKHHCRRTVKKKERT